MNKVRDFLFIFRVPEKSHGGLILFCLIMSSIEGEKDHSTWTTLISPFHGESGPNQLSKWIGMRREGKDKNKP